MLFKETFALPRIFPRDPAKVPSREVSVDSIHKNVMGIEEINELSGYAVIPIGNDVEGECPVYETHLRTVEGVDRLGDGNGLKSELLTTLRNLWLNQAQRRREASQVGMIDGLTADELGASSKDPSQIRNIVERP